MPVFAPGPAFPVAMYTPLRPCSSAAQFTVVCSFGCPPCSSSFSFSSLASVGSSSSSASRLVISCEMEAQDDCGKWRQIPAFGDWNMWEEMPVSQYFEPAATFFFTAQAGEDDVDLFKVPHFAANPYTYKKCVVRVKKGEENEKPNANANAGAVPGRRKKGGRKQQQQQHHQQGKKEQQQQRRKKPKAKAAAAAAAAVDEDLYKISPNVICKVQKKKLLRNLLGGCLGLNCIA